MPEQSHLISALLAVPLLTGVLSLAAVRNLPVGRALSVLSFSVNALIAGALLWLIQGQSGASSVLVSQAGGWPAPWGISLVFDQLSGPLVLATSIVALGCSVYARCTLKRDHERRYFHPLMQFIVFGVTLSFMTGDVFNLFVAFEVMLMASYALLILGTGRAQMAQAYKYVLINLLASTVFVMAAGMLYGLTGTLNMADLARIVAEANLAAEARAGGVVPDPAMTPLPTGFTALGVLMLLVFATKAALFPLWFWLPDTYWTAPAPILAFFGGVLTKVGAYAIARLFALGFAVGDTTGTIPMVLAWAAGLTMGVAAIGALGYTSVRRVLCMQLICGVGTMGFGIAVMTADGLGGAAFYAAQSMIVTTVLFMCCGLMEKHAGTDDLKKLGGLLRRDTALGVMTFVALMSLVGLPPFSGFFGKALIFRAAWASGHTALAVTGMVVGALVLLSALRVWGSGFWGPTAGPPANDAKTVRRLNRSAYWATGGLLAVSLAMGVFAQPLLSIGHAAGRQLVDPADYVEAVLGDAGVRRIRTTRGQIGGHDQPPRRAMPDTPDVVMESRLEGGDG